ncbi:hypothetical protein CkaCkLH20_01640 [Colletotrichum karsti]|uniref:Uncharacterized protein n=1 Tax=Colletotrichum karsti TaxID=1095194 RepID=A0A9P6IBJ8_9PEZI|nr:uncharacterized protein CkaCkLH20_01640 [Colletotrichum karsti]KAF9880598.1 hypothetical protein CkaCkLH20_01640 [Colletotrichum karsti]
MPIIHHRGRCRSSPLKALALSGIVSGDDSRSVRPSARYMISNGASGQFTEFPRTTSSLRCSGIPATAVAMEEIKGTNVASTDVSRNASSGTSSSASLAPMTG